MKTSSENPKSYGKVAGLLYLLIAIVGGFSIGLMPEEIVRMDDAAATFENLEANRSTFIWGVAGDIFVLIAETVLTVMLFLLFKSWNRTGMTIAAFSRLAMAIVMALNLLNYMAPLLFLEEANFLQVFNEEQRAAMVLLFFKLHKYGEYAWQIFFAIHLFCLGLVLFRVPKVSKWLASIMLLGGVAYAGDCLIRFLWVDQAWLVQTFGYMLILAVVSEFWFAIWLLLKGGSPQRLIFGPDSSAS